MSTSAFDFIALRKRLGLNQAQMAEMLDVSPRTYFSLENDPAAIKPGHVRAAEMLALELAVERGDASLAPERVAELAKKLTALLHN
jgi:DNA-binding XRE family transcriptional regulator